MSIVDLLVYLSTPVLIFAGVVKIYLAMHARYHPWSVGVPGIGGSVVIGGYCVYWQFNELLGLSVVLFGVALMLFPLIRDALKPYVESGGRPV
ncbi:hypothetical protein IHN63_00350 [Deinococcus sp. 6YEL10]|uniref:hypothetical protein n=1 Tax=Deinococcus sp. 6YEL10 TaxID=2745870 RepID=UPI001E354133|nr:hypothetical protein [Deinococcus sp. 6YEL10]MCD0159749.1 hypothetical protein [Deinococcus sp. 6YEL10]